MIKAEFCFRNDFLRIGRGIGLDGTSFFGIPFSSVVLRHYKRHFLVHRPVSQLVGPRLLPKGISEVCYHHSMEEVRTKTKKNRDHINVCNMQRKI